VTRLIVFSDLDGTLLDHETYSYAPAQPALDRLRAQAIPLVLATSKTAAEVADLRADMGFADYPAIVENGAGVLPAGATKAATDASGDDHVRLIAALNQIPDALRAGFAGFTDWGPDGIAEKTGLSRDQAAKAGQRQFSEPGIWHGARADEDRFIAELARRGVAARRGGRFLTLSFVATKAGQMTAIRDAIAPGARMMALGDAPNDAEMIAAADIGVVVANPTAPDFTDLLGDAAGTVRRTTRAGPSGWNQAVLQVVNQTEAS